MDNSIALPEAKPITSNALYAVADKWLAHLDAQVSADEISQATRDSYAQGFQRFADFVNRSPIGTSIILAWLADLKRRGIKPATANTWLSAVRSLFRFAATYAGMNFDPTAGIRGARRAGTSKRHKTATLTNAEMIRVLDAPNDSTIGKRDKAIIALMAYTGARTVEVWRANFEHLDTLDGHMVLHVQGKGHTETDDLIVIAHPEAQTALYEWVAERGREPGALFTSQSRRTRDTRLSRSYIRRLVKSYYRAAGIVGENKRTHSLRHTAATNAIQHGASIQQAQAMLRHANISTTMIYFHETQRTENPAEKFIDYSRM